jgi:GNAT superfamily N-acetyltransferase
MEEKLEILCEIREYSDFDYITFKKMLELCFLQDYNITLTEQQSEELCKDLTQQVNAQIQSLGLLFLNGVAKGFINYQVDSPKSDWCEKETWGFIREVYIARDIREKGYGKKLVVYAENKLRGLSVPNIYLTTDEAKEFWIKLGYCVTGDICEKNKGCILIK